MKICMIGSGAMGSVYGGLLCAAGYDITLLDLRADHIAAIRANGLRVDGKAGEHLVRPPAFDNHASLAPFDAAIIFVDSNSTHAAAQTASDILKLDGFAMTLQNGIGNVEVLTEKLGAARVLAGVSMDSGNYRGPGHASLTNSGPISMGELDGRMTPRLDAMVDALNKAGLIAHKVDCAKDYIWQKFALNCAINPLAALTGMRAGEFMEIPEIDALQDRILDEITAVGKAKGVSYPDPNWRDHVKSHRRYNQPSMLQHVIQGRRTEIDTINGALVREGRKLGVPVPYNETIVALIKGLEKQRERELHQPPIDYSHLEALAAAKAKAES